MERKHSSLPNAGRGLFTKRNILKHELVIWIKNPVEIGEADLDSLEYDDSAILVTVIRKINNRNRKFYAWITDKKNVKTQDWYYQNHSSHLANTTMKLISISEKTQTVGWFAKRDIAAGEELFFNYNPGCNVKF
jgi:SET domain-containing protein